MLTPELVALAKAIADDGEDLAAAALRITRGDAEVARALLQAWRRFEARVQNAPPEVHTLQ